MRDDIDQHIEAGSDQWWEIKYAAFLHEASERLESRLRLTVRQIPQIAQAIQEEISGQLRVVDTERSPHVSMDSNDSHVRSMIGLEIDVAPVPALIDALANKVKHVKYRSQVDPVQWKSRREVALACLEAWYILCNKAVLADQRPQDYINLLMRFHHMVGKTMLACEVEPNQDAFSDIYYILACEAKLDLSLDMLSQLDELSHYAYEHNMKYDGNELYVGSMFSALQNIIRASRGAKERSSLSNDQSNSSHMHDLVSYCVTRAKVDECQNDAALLMDMMSAFAIPSEKEEKYQQAEKQYVIKIMREMAERLYQYLCDNPEETITKDRQRAAIAILKEIKVIIDALFDEEKPLNARKALARLIAFSKSKEEKGRGEFFDIVNNVSSKKLPVDIMSTEYAHCRAIEHTKAFVMMDFRKIPSTNHLKFRGKVRSPRAQNFILKLFNWFCTLFADQAPTPVVVSQNKTSKPDIKAIIESTRLEKLKAVDLEKQKQLEQDEKEIEMQESPRPETMAVKQVKKREGLSARRHFNSVGLYVDVSPDVNLRRHVLNKVHLSPSGSSPGGRRVLKPTG